MGDEVGILWGRTFQHSGLVTLGSIHLLERGEDGKVQGRLEPMSPVGWEVDAGGVRDSEGPSGMLCACGRGPGGFVLAWRGS